MRMHIDGCIKMVIQPRFFDKGPLSLADFNQSHDRQALKCLAYRGTTHAQHFDQETFRREAVALFQGAISYLLHQLINDRFNNSRFPWWLKLDSGRHKLPLANSLNGWIEVSDKINASDLLMSILI